MADDATDLDPETLVRMGTIETLNQGEREAAPGYFADDLDYYNSEDEYGGFDKLMDDSLTFADAFPDLEADVQETVVEEDSVMFRYTVRGTHDQPLDDVPPTGEFFETQGIGYAHIDDGRIDEYQLVFDRLGMFQQLGIV